MFWVSWTIPLRDTPETDQHAWHQTYNYLNLRTQKFSVAMSLSLIVLLL